MKGQQNFPVKKRNNIKRQKIHLTNLKQGEDGAI